MLGWHISVYQKVGDAGAVTEAVQGKRIAVWQAGPFGLRWLDALVKQGHGEYLGGGGWPSRYMFQAKDILPRILDGPPEANEVWIKGPEDIVTDKWEVLFSGVYFLNPKRQIAYAHRLSRPPSLCCIKIR